MRFFGPAGCVALGISEAAGGHASSPGALAETAADELFGACIVPERPDTPLGDHNLPCQPMLGAATPRLLLEDRSEGDDGLGSRISEPQADASVAMGRRPLDRHTSEVSEERDMQLLQIQQVESQAELVRMGTGTEDLVWALARLTSIREELAEQQSRMVADRVRLQAALEGLTADNAEMARQLGVLAEDRQHLLQAVGELSRGNLELVERRSQSTAVRDRQARTLEDLVFERQGALDAALSAETQSRSLQGSARWAEDSVHPTVMWCFGLVCVGLPSAVMLTLLVMLCVHARGAEQGKTALPHVPHSSRTPRTKKSSSTITAVTASSPPSKGGRQTQQSTSKKAPSRQPEMPCCCKTPTLSVNSAAALAPQVSAKPATHDRGVQAGDESGGGTLAATLQLKMVPGGTPVNSEQITQSGASCSVSEDCDLSLCEQVSSLPSPWPELQELPTQELSHESEPRLDDVTEPLPPLPAHCAQPGEAEEQFASTMRTEPSPEPALGDDASWNVGHMAEEPVQLESSVFPRFGAEARRPQNASSLQQWALQLGAQIDACQGFEMRLRAELASVLSELGRSRPYED